MRNPETQCDRILTLLQVRKQAGAFVYEICAPRPQGLGISQYNARIKELRESGHRIINTKPGHFVLEETTMNGYDRFKQMGERLQQDAGVYYQKLSQQELLEKKAIAEQWLAEHMNHPKKQEAEKRYEQLCATIREREVQEALI